MARILVVEDEKDLQDVLSYNLRQAGHEATLVETGQEALARVGTETPDLILLDLMLPDMSGIDVCRALKSGPATRHIPVVMLTAKGEEIDRVVGFELGADDYVVKPFSVRELVLRVNAILRSRGRPGASEPAAAAPAARRRYVVGPLEVDVDGYHVFVGGEEVHMSAMEMRLLIYLVEHRGRVRSREDLLEDVWGYKPGVSTRTVSTRDPATPSLSRSRFTCVSTVRVDTPGL